MMRLLPSVILSIIIYVLDISLHVKTNIETVISLLLNKDKCQLVLSSLHIISVHNIGVKLTSLNV